MLRIREAMDVVPLSPTQKPGPTDVLIRPARAEDGRVLVRLLDLLGYPGSEPFIQARIRELGQREDDHLLVAEVGGQAKAFISLHFIPQLALAGDFARISYLCVDQDSQGMGIGKLLLARAEELARERGCDRMEVHSALRREGAHQFYDALGYFDSPKYLIKKL